MAEGRTFYCRTRASVLRLVYICERSGFLCERRDSKRCQAHITEMAVKKMVMNMRAHAHGNIICACVTIWHARTQV